MFTVLNRKAVSNPQITYELITSREPFTLYGHPQDTKGQHMQLSIHILIQLPMCENREYMSDISVCKCPTILFLDFSFSIL